MVAAPMRGRLCIRLTHPAYLPQGAKTRHYLPVCGIGATSSDTSRTGPISPDGCRAAPFRQSRHDVNV